MADIRGTGGNDILHGTNGSAVISNLTGDDELYGEVGRPFALTIKDHLELAGRYSEPTA